MVYCDNGENIFWFGLSFYTNTTPHHRSEYTGRAKPNYTEVVMVELPDYQGPFMPDLTRRGSATNVELRRLEAIGGKEFLFGTVLPVRLGSVCPAAQEAASRALHEDYKRAEDYLDEQFKEPLKVGELGI